MTPHPCPTLLPCPFCGGTGVKHCPFTDEKDENYGGEVIECMSCLCSTRVFFGEKDGLIEAWNTRTATNGKSHE